MHMRAATMDDAAVVGALMRELGYELDDAEAARRVEGVLGTGCDEVNLLVEGGDALGLLALRRGPALYRPLPIATITVLVVQARARRRGAGRFMIEYAIRWARENGCCLVALTTGRDRTEAHAFYRAVGFEATSIRFHRNLERHNS